MPAKIILDLCGGTGSWSKPYRDAGYDVRIVTIPAHDVRTFVPPPNVHGILAAPPCTHFTNSGAQYWKAKDQDGRTLADLEILTACIRIVAMSKPKWWALENPVGRMRRWMGPPAFKFDPCDFGDAYTKKTLLWGDFTIPEKNPVEPVFVTMKNGDRYSPINAKTGGRSERSKEIRSMTPQGFARAFFKANR